MEKHTKNYMKAFGYSKGDFIACEACGSGAIDIHHVEPRSSFGSKRKKEQDHVSNLIALCRPCHEEAHGYQSKMVKQALKEIIRRRSVNAETLK